MGVMRNVSHVLAALFNDRAEFNRRWNEPPARPEGLEGRWQGEWVSEANGHRGALRCLMTKARDGGYEAAFHATYARFLAVAYTVTLQGAAEGGKWRLEGQADLGQLAGGVYHYKGDGDESAFDCAYRCAYDHGTFHLRRLPL